MYGQKPPLEQYTIDYSVDVDLAVTGPLGRSAEDLDLVMDLAVMPAKPQRKAFKIELPAPRKVSLKDYKIGLWIDDPIFPPDNDVGNCLQNMVNGLSKAGANIEEKKPDINFAECLENYYNLLCLATAFAVPQDEFDKMLQSAKKQESTSKNWFAKATSSLHREWQLLDIERSLMRQKWDDYFKEFDVLLCPAVRVPAVKHNQTDISTRQTRFNDQKLLYWDVMMPWAGLTVVSYLPATVAPIGLTSSGLPVGVQIVGPYLEDRTTIHMAKLIEETFNSFSPPPGFE